MVLFKRFRGHNPDSHALLRLRGFEPKLEKKGKSKKK